jgi:endonuclease III
MPKKSDNALQIKAQITKARAIFKKLKQAHPDAHIELVYKTPLELMIATILSAQCTDIRVNQVTAVLFKKFKKPEDYVKKSQAELEEIIRPTGFFRQKAKSIRGAVKIILDKHQGEVPQTMEELTKLPGVGRKTANVILGNAFGIPGMPVDTHVTRIANRLGLTKESDAVKIETDLTKLIAKKDWTQFSHTLIFHGRRICKARSPQCEKCNVKEFCNYFEENAG